MICVDPERPAGDFPFSTFLPLPRQRDPCLTPLTERQTEGHAGREQSFYFLGELALANQSGLISTLRNRTMPPPY
jgi:hypothetical protein